MPKPSNREKILTEGLRVMHERGYAGASVRDIVQAAGVPQGSFTNHFASKEAFCLEALELYYQRGTESARQTLLNETLTPLARLEAWLDVNRSKLTDGGMRKGCLFGNFSAEASEHSEIIRNRLVEMFAEVTRAVADCLRAAVRAGELQPGLDCDEVAGFVMSSMQGAILMAKAQRSLVPIQRFRNILFSMILR
jgi:TetR/AcrR family transcriptional regulator, transcriptional repressor for nem operon